MGLFTGKSADDYAAPVSPQPEQGNGPWGTAIRYWMHKKGLSQADLVRPTKLVKKLGKNTVSYAVRGLDTSTATLRLIAEKLGEPLELILVSPEWKDREADRERVIVASVSRALREMDLARAGVPPTTIEAAQATMRDVESRLAEKVLPKSSQKPIKIKRGKHDGRRNK